MRKLSILSLLLFVCMAFTGISVQAEEPLRVPIPVVCSSDQSNESFTYTIEETDEKSVDINTTSMTLNGGQLGAFILTFNTPDVYHFEITQTGKSISAGENDDTAYTVDVYVTENDEGVLRGDPVIYVKGQSEKRQECSFTGLKESSKIDLPSPPPKEEESKPSDKTDHETDEDTDKNDDDDGQDDSTRHISTSTTRTTSTTSSGTTDSDSSSPLIAKNAKTGDIQPIFIYGFIFLISAAFVISFTKRRNYD